MGKTILLTSYSFFFDDFNSSLAKRRVILLGLAWITVVLLVVSCLKQYRVLYHHSAVGLVGENALMIKLQRSISPADLVTSSSRSS